MSLSLKIQSIKWCIVVSFPIYLIILGWGCSAPLSHCAKRSESNYSAVQAAAPPEVAVSHHLQRLRSAAGLRGVRLIVAGLNGGQSRVVAVAPRTITLGRSQFLAWLGPPLRTSGFNSWSWLSCTQPVLKRTRRQWFCAIFRHTCVPIASGEVNTVHGGELTAAGLRAEPWEILWNWWGNACFCSSTTEGSPTGPSRTKLCGRGTGCGVPCRRWASSAWQSRWWAKERLRQHPPLRGSRSVFPYKLGPVQCAWDTMCATMHQLL